MTVSNTQAVSGASMGGYVPQQEQVVTPIAAPETITPKVEAPSSSSKEKENGGEKDGAQNQAAIRKAVADINKRANGTEAIFGFHDKTKSITIKIVDKESKEVIREVPAEKTLDLIAKAWEMAGLMVDEKR